MKKFVFLLCLAAAPLLFAEFPAMDITTLDGQIFRNVEIEGVNPGGIDIGYLNNDGNYVLKGLSFKILPEDLRKRFGYDPERSENFERKVKEYSGKEMTQVAEAEKNRLDRITREIKSKFAGQKITIKPEDLQFAIHAGRRNATVQVVEATRSGCVVQVKKIDSGAKIDAQFIQIDGLELPRDGQGDWTGFLYPTGLKAVYRQKEIPVFSDNLDDAARLVNHYLEIYSEYAAEQSSAAGAAQTAANVPASVAAPDQSLENVQPTTATTTTATDNGSASADNSNTAASDYSNQNYPYYVGGYPANYIGGGIYGGYYIGNYYPVQWWHHHHHRPCPPRPPRPPRPTPPGPPPRPYPRPPAIGTPGNPAYSQPQPTPGFLTPQPRPTTNKAPLYSNEQPQPRPQPTPPTSGILTPQPRPTTGKAPLYSNEQPRPQPPPTQQRPQPRPIQPNRPGATIPASNRYVRPEGGYLQTAPPMRQPAYIQRSGNFRRPAR